MTRGHTSTRRHDTLEIGHLGEKLAEGLMRELGWQVFNLNETHRRNHPVTDLVAYKNGRKVDISVKCSRTRDIHLGKPESLEKLPDAAFVIVIMSPSRNEEISFKTGRYEVWLVPGKKAREEALEVHRHYWGYLEPKYAVMLKDKNDTSPRTRSGEFFRSWCRRYKDAWHLLDQ
jgi:hypothetical protein